MKITIKEFSKKMIFILLFDLFLSYSAKLHFYSSQEIYRRAKISKIVSVNCLIFIRSSDMAKIIYQS